MFVQVCRRHGRTNLPHHGAYRFASLDVERVGQAGRGHLRIIAHDANRFEPHHQRQSRSGHHGAVPEPYLATSPRALPTLAALEPTSSIMPAVGTFPVGLLETMDEVRGTGGLGGKDLLGRGLTDWLGL